MSQPGDQVAGAWALRAAHADRERVVDLLKAAFVQGRLTKDEFGARVSQTLGSRTYAELAAITAGIPAGPVAARSPRQQGRVLTPTEQGRVLTPTDVAVTWSAAAMFVAVTLVASMFLTPGYFILVAGVVFGIVFATGAQMLYSRHESRTRGKLPPRPGPAS